MARKSKKLNNHNNSSSSESSENADDPDYPNSRGLQTRSKQKNLPSFKGKNNEDIKMECQGLEISEGTSSMKPKRGRLPKMDYGQEEMQDIKRPRHATMKKEGESSDADQSSMARRKRKSENQNRQGNKYSICRRKRKSEIDQNDDNQEIKGTILSWLIDSKTIAENTKVVCVDEIHRQTIKEGKITKEGIFCSCCDEVFNAAYFQCHSTKKIKKPYENILMAENGVSLLSCLAETWNRVDESQRLGWFNSIDGGNASDSYDDACMICADGGNLMCCEECNSTYHHVCMGMEAIPEGSWHCPYCVCKFCGDLARENDYLFTCSQCEKRYHWECYQGREEMVIDINSTPCAPFCGQGCKQIFEKLEQMIGAKNQLPEGYNWSLLRRMDQSFGVFIQDLDKRSDCHSKLALAWSVMEECFEPIIDRHTKINVIQSIITNCGSNFQRISFRGFYNAILEENNEIISVASLRIHGTKLAEIPFIATHDTYRRRGMCKKLLIAIESALCYLKVENLVIPSIKERIGSWISRYGFSRVNAALTKEIRGLDTLMFHDSLRLQKTLLSPADLKQPDRPVSEAKMIREAEKNDCEDGPSVEDKSTIPPLLDLNLNPPE